MSLLSSIAARSSSREKIPVIAGVVDAVRHVPPSRVPPSRRGFPGKCSSTAMLRLTVQRMPSASRDVEQPPEADTVAVVALRVAEQVRMRRARPRIARADVLRQIFVMLDIWHHPECHARPVRPAQRRAMQDRRIGDKVRFHGAPPRCDGKRRRCMRVRSRLPVYPLRLDRQSDQRNLRTQEDRAMANTQAITDLLKRATDAGDVPGVVVAAATADGTIFAGGSGMRDATSGAPMTARHRRLDRLDDQGGHRRLRHAACGAGQAVARWTDRGGVAGARQGAGARRLHGGRFARLRPARRPITLRHLLTHTSGFVYDIWNPEHGPLPRDDQHAWHHLLRQCRLVDAAACSIPGERWDYGIGIDWAGKAVEAVSGQRLECLYAAEPARASRHGGYRIQDRSRATATPGEGA